MELVSGLGVRAFCSYSLLLLSKVPVVSGTAWLLVLVPEKREVCAVRSCVCTPTWA